MPPKYGKKLQDFCCFFMWAGKKTACLPLNPCQRKLHVQQHNIISCFSQCKKVPISFIIRCYFLALILFPVKSKGLLLFNSDVAALYPFQTCTLQERFLITLKEKHAWRIVAALIFVLSVLHIHLVKLCFRHLIQNPQAFDNWNTEFKSCNTFLKKMHHWILSEFDY